MPTFEQGHTVRVPFPYTDRSTRQRRPALVISDGPVGEGAALVWVLMITSAENRRWAGDIPLGPDQEMAGLSSASVIRPCKIATVDAADLHPLGRISSALQEETRGAVASLLRNASSQGPGRAGS